MSEKQLKVVITGDSKLLFQALEKSSMQVKSFAKDISTMSGAVQSTFASMKAPIVAVLGLIGGGAFLKSAVDETKNWTIEATKLSKTLGITTESASVMNIAIGDIHGSVDEFMPIIGKLTRTINTDEEAFKRLGVATRDSRGHLRSTVDIMLDTNKALLGMKEGTDRNVEAARIYGRGWMDVRKYLGLTNETLQEAHDKAEKLNLIVGQDAVDATKAYRDSLNELDDTTKALKVRLGAELMPLLTALNNDMAENGPQAVSSLSNAFSGLYQMLNAVRETMRRNWEETEYTFRSLINIGEAAAKIALQVQGGNLKGVSSTWKSFLSGQAEEEKTHWRTIQSIRDDYTESTQRLMGLGPKSKAKAQDTDSDTSENKSQGKPKENVYAEELNKLDAERAKILREQTKEAKALADWDQIQTKLQEQLLRYAKEVKDHRLSPSQAKTLGSQANAIAEAQQKALLEREQKEDEDASQKYWEAREERSKTHRLANLDLEQADIQQRYEMGEIGYEQQLDMLSKIENEKYEIERASIQKRLALLHTEDNQERVKLNGELQKLQDEHAKSVQGTQFQRESNKQQASPLAGVKAYIAQGKAALRDWKSITQQTLQGVENAFARGISGILSGQMTLGQGLKAIWEGITSTIIELLAQLAAKWIVTAIAAKIFKDDTASAAQESAIANQESAASQIWATYSSIPYVGPVIAAAYIGVMNASLAANAASAKGIVGAAEGGWFDRPTRAIIGEGWQRELVVPEVSFQSYSKNLARNIIDNERQTASYQRHGSASGGGDTIIHVHGHVLDQSGRGLQTLARSNQRASIHSSSRSSYRINANTRTMA